MREVLDAPQAGIDASDVLQRIGVKSRKFILVSMHRAENVDIPDHLRSLLVGDESALREATSFPSSSAPTRERVIASKRWISRFTETFSSSNRLATTTTCAAEEAFCTLSDSGTISEEASILGFPAVTMRTRWNAPKRWIPGHIVLTGLDTDTILQSIEL